MKDFLKKIKLAVYYTLVDKYSFDNNTSVFKRILFTLRFRLAGLGFFLNKNEKIIKSQRNKFKGKRCFVIGNGPSLNNLDLTLLKDEITFGVNAIYLNYDKMKFHPTFYVIEDNLVAEDRCNEINNYKGPQIKFIGSYLNHVIKKDEKTVYINIRRNYIDKQNFPLFSENCARFLGVGGSVTYVCLQLAFYMGFSEVFMIGFDHNYIIPESAKVYNKRSTGFDIISTEDDPNHFDKSYFGKGYRWHDPNVERMEVGFKKAKAHFEANGRKVFNATAGGNLNVFERKNYNEIFL